MANCRAVEHFYLKFCFLAASAILSAALKIQKNLFSKRVRRGEKRVKPREPFFESKTNRNYLARLSQGEYFLLKYDRHKNGQKKNPP